MMHVTRMVLHHQQHPHHGGNDIDECRLLTIEDSTAERQFHCIVFQLAIDFIFHFNTLSSKQSRTMDPRGFRSDRVCIYLHFFLYFFYVFLFFFMFFYFFYFKSFFFFCFF